MKIIARTYSININVNSTSKFNENDINDNYEYLINSCFNYTDEEVEDFELCDDVKHYSRHNLYITRYYAINNYGEDNEEIIACSVPPIEYNADRELIIEDYTCLVFFKIKNSDIKEVYDNVDDTEVLDLFTLKISSDDVEATAEFLETDDSEEIAESLYGDVESLHSFDFTYEEKQQLLNHIEFQVSSYLSKM